jgi:hypothetical protein
MTSSLSHLFDPGTFWTLVAHEEGDYDDREQHSYLRASTHYAETLLDFRTAPAWWAISPRRDEIKAFVYSKRDGEVLVRHLGGGVTEETGYGGDKYLLWKRKIKVTIDYMEES